MSGHSKWHNIKIKKGKQDALRAKNFTRASKEIIIAVKQGGPDPSANLGLQNAIERAKALNVPNDNIKRTIEKAVGSGDGSQLEEVYYEGYGTAGVAILVKAATDNKNRTSAMIRSIFTKFGGNMGESGSVKWMFKQKGLIQVQAKAISEEKLMEIALEAGADDLSSGEEFYEIETSLEFFAPVKAALLAQKIPLESADISMVPQNQIVLNAVDAAKILRLMEKMEEDEDVQDVYANFDIPEDVLESLAD